MGDHIHESRIERAATDYAETRGWWEIKIKMASKNGVPDRLFLRDGRYVWIEFKRPGEVPRPQQVKRIADMRAHGAEVFVCDNLDDAKRILL